MDNKYLFISQVCELAGISRSTLLRWIKTGVVPEVKNRDRNGWRLFSEAEQALVYNEAGRVLVG